MWIILIEILIFMIKKIVVFSNGGYSETVETIKPPETELYSLPNNNLKPRWRNKNPLSHFANLTPAI